MPKIIVNGQSVEDAIASVASAGSVPIGGIIPWMSPTLGAPQPAAPTGFEYCDGTVVSTPGPMFGFTKPALMKSVAAPGVTQRMVRGGNTNVAYGGATALVIGGADTHTHTGTTDLAGSHSHSVNNHTHPIPSQPANNTGYAVDTGPTASGVFFRYDGSPGSHRHVVSAHDHGGNTSNGTATTAAVAAHLHNLTPNASANIPSFVELAWIIRCV